MMTNNDKNRLRALMERYNYNEFNVLNESFQSSTLGKLIDINKRDHIGLSGEKEEALSPIGANFLTAFPIHWDRVPEKNVRLMVNPRVKQHSPRQEEKFDKNLNKYSWAKDNDERSQFKLGSYVSSGAKDEDVRDLFVKYAGRLKREITYLTKIKDQSEKGTFNGWDLRVLSTYKKSAKPIVEDISILQKAYDVLYWMTLPSINKDSVDKITNYDPNELKDLHRHIGENRFISAINDAKQYLKDNDGKTPESVMRTREDYLDDFESIRDLEYPKVGALLDLLKDKNFIDESSIRKLKKEYVDKFKNEYIPNQRRIVWMINRIKYLGLNKTDNEFVKDPKNLGEFNDKMISLRKELFDKTVGKSSEVGDLLKLYINAESAGDNANTKIKTYIDTILSSFSDDKNDDNYKIAILTDVRFKILYVLSNLKLDDVGYESGNAIYGWEEGMSPAVYETPVSDIDGKTTKVHKVEYDFTKQIDMNYIKEDNRVRCAFFVTGKTNSSDVLKTTKDIDKLNAKLAKVIGEDKSLSSTDFETGGIESKDMDDIKALFDKYELPYEIKDGKLYCEITGENVLEDNNLVRVLGIVGQNKLDKGQIRKYLNDIRSATIETKMFWDIKKYSKTDFDEYYKDKLDSLDFSVKEKKSSYDKWLKNSAAIKVNGKNVFQDSSDSFDKRKYYDEVYVGAGIYNMISKNIKTAKTDLEDYVTAHNKYVRFYLKGAYLKDTANIGGNDIRYTQALKKAREMARNTPERMANKERQFKNSPLANLDIANKDPKIRKVNAFISNTDSDIDYIESTSPKSKNGGKWFDIYETVIMTTPEFDVPDVPQFYSRFVGRIANILRAYQNLAKRYPDKLDIMKDRESQIAEGYSDLVGNINGILAEIEDKEVLASMGKPHKANEYTERIASVIMEYSKLLEDARYEIDKIKAGN